MIPIEWFVQNMNMKSVETLQYHSIKKPVPKGWRVVKPVVQSHHSRYSILIEKI